MALTPFPPITERPLPDKFGAGMSRLPRWTDDDRAESEFFHSMVGWLWSTDAYFRMPSVFAATDYGIGGVGDGAYDGVIFRWINYYERRNTAGWASGWGDDGPGIEGDGQALLDQLGPDAINGTGRSVEFSGLVASPMTSKQWAAGIHLSAALHHHELKQGYEEYAWNMHHKELAKKDCPFPRIYNHTVAYQTATKQIMEHFETGRDMPDTATIGEFVVPLPWDAVDIPPIQPPSDGPIFVPFAKEFIAHTVKGAVSRRWGYVPDDEAEAADNPIIRRYEPGTRLRLGGYYRGEPVNGRDEWLVIRSPGPSNNARIHVSGIKEPIPGIYLTGLPS